MAPVAYLKIVFILLELMQIKHNSVSQTSNRDVGDTNTIALYLQREQEAETTKGKV